MQSVSLATFWSEFNYLFKKSVPSTLEICRHGQKKIRFPLVKKVSANFQNNLENHSQVIEPEISFLNFICCFSCFKDPLSLLERHLYSSEKQTNKLKKRNIKKKKKKKNRKTTTYKEAMLLKLMRTVFFFHLVRAWASRNYTINQHLLFLI